MGWTNVYLTNQSFTRLRRLLRLRQKYEEGLLLRLTNLEERPPGGFVLHGQPVGYESVCRTHLCLDAKEKQGDETLRDVVHHSGELPRLDGSRLANALGINLLLLTADGRAVMPRRSKKVVVRPSELSPSASGDFNYEDVPRRATTFESIHLLREAREELHLSEEDLVSDSISFLGMTRELVRGGKPEMFFSALTKLTQEQFTDRHSRAVDRWEFTRSARGWVFWPFGTEALTQNPDPNQRHDLRADFEKLLSREGYRMSVPLLTNLVLWMRSKLGDDFRGGEVCAWPL